MPELPNCGHRFAGRLPEDRERPEDRDEPADWEPDFSDTEDDMERARR